MGILRACAPYAASFQGSRLGRVLTRSFFQTANHRWLPIQRIRDLNLAVSQERDEVSENADLAKLAKKIAKALGKAQSLGLDGMRGQNEALAEEGFRQVGSGSGGYTVYECHRIVRFPGGPHDDERQTILLHLTPYGPSLLDVLPRYIVLEKENSQDRRAAWSETIASKQWEGPSVVEGYAYQGAFFSPHHFAEMKETYDKQLLAYDSACKAMAKPGRKAAAPTDLPTLKAFLADGKLPRKRKKNNREFRILQSEVRMVARKLKSMMSSGSKEGTAPRGVILYFEGLDCSGKSSTGGLVQQALNDAGFHVEMRQYNRPPTVEQKLRPWMDRFELPDTSPEEIAAKGETLGNDENRHRHTCVVWDRGPAGDFVYGALASVAESEKRDRYREFIAFDAECRRKNILFVKLMFVTNRDSIASTLGKRLAQRKMAQDLRTWLKASYGDEKGNHDILMEGLDFIDRHIDPTDFIAFNMYQRNLRCFANFALNTDTASNPWVVVNTSDRFAARKQLLKMFCRQLDTYAEFKRHEAGEGSCCRKLLCCTPSTRSDEEQAETPGIEMWQMANWKTKKGLSMQTVLALMGLLILLFLYGENTAYDNLKVPK
jgi:polyphosphate kinase 2 (PPK2 family)